MNGVAQPQIVLMGEREYRRNRSGNNNQSPGPITDYERRMRSEGAGYSEDGTNLSIEQLESDDELLYSRFGSNSETEENEILEIAQAPKQQEENSTPILDVANLTTVEKLVEAVNRAARHLPGEVAEDLKAILSPTAIASMAAIFAAYAASHAAGIGFIADVAFIVGGSVFLGWQIIDVVKDLIGFSQAVNATTEAELDKAGEHLASAISTVGVDIVIGLLTKKAASKIKNRTNGIDDVASSADNVDDINAGRVDDIDNTNSNRTDIDEPQQNRPTQSNDSPEVANQSSKPTGEIVSDINNRINSSPDKFELVYSDTEINNLVQEGRKLGLDDATIEDLIFIGSRRAKPISSGELITQMDNYVNTVSKRGYPYKFTDLEQFNSFKADLTSGLQSIGISIDDVRIQGSSLRTPDANDVDLVTLIDDTQFDKLLVDRYDNRIKLKTDDASIDLSSKSHDELLNLAQEIDANRQLYNGQSKTFAKAMLDRFFNSKSDISKPLKQLRKKLTNDYPNLNIEAIAIQTRGGEFDLQPFLNIE